MHVAATTNGFDTSHWAADRAGALAKSRARVNGGAVNQSVCFNSVDHNDNTMRNRLVAAVKDQATVGWTVVKGSSKLYSWAGVTIPSGNAIPNAMSAWKQDGEVRDNGASLHPKWYGTIWLGKTKSEEWSRAVMYHIGYERAYNGQ
ncbi:hypothetical protein BUE93_21835 [Chromobacterium amazonense]|uniref:Uncharacterized protein n=1 Tax=Chromobacterium amazonense TaxID=1382803 RepID=A0A2S9WYJ4_9NEIS|nr:hypothetical protein [Chromobacterium amazonense]PRP68533.1 hypothetical protein BUE93_21835 [Chromobacterium amazonense]